MIKILIVDDEKPICDLIDLNLSSAGYHCTAVQDGLRAIDLIEKDSFDLVLLDIMLPGADGYDVMEYIRPLGIPVIFITAKYEVKNRVKGLKLGADDYMEKPFDSKELVARVKAVLRRYKPVAAASGASDTKCVEYPDLVVNQTNYSVLYMGKTVEMPPKELELLYYLAASPNQVFTREQLLDQIWGYEYVGDTRTVDVHIKRLREKINDHEKWRIATIWGVGYKFETRA